MLAILGRNGSGKTLTLHTLAGLRAAGRAARSRSMARRSPRSRAAPWRSASALLPQDLEDAFVTTALETVLIGRHPHLALWQWETAEDERIARAALAAVEMSEFAQRRTDTLSGGEQRRVAVAALIAQQAETSSWMSRPITWTRTTSSRSLTLFRELAGEGSTVITTLHDPTLAARFADRALLLFGDGRWHLGPVRARTHRRTR